MTTDFAELTRRLLDICKVHGVLVATAESCTGGMIVAMMTDLPGSSSMVDRGFVTYSNEAKIEMLPVVESGRLVGVITESDLIDAFIEIMGFRDHGTRLVIEARDVPGALAQMGSITSKHGANVQHLAVYRGSGETSDVVLGVNTADTTELEADLAAAGFTVRGRLEND